MANKIPSDPSMKIVLDLLKKEIFTSLNCHAVGEIQSFNPLNQTAMISIAYSRNSINDDLVTSSTKDYPVLVDCPCLISSGGKGSLRFPIQRGDFALVCFNDRDIDNWFINGAKGFLASDRKHSFSDAVALVGLFPSISSISNYSATKTQLVHDTTKISLSDKVKIENASQNLYTILSGVLDVLIAFTSTNCVPGAPVALSPPQIVQLNLLKTNLSALME